MDFITILGFVAGVLTTFSFLPQVIKIWRTKSTKDISLPMYVIYTTGIFLWLVYGVLLNQSPIYIANIIAFILVSSILILKIKHG